MPGPIVHLVVQQRLEQYLKEVGGETGRDYARLLENEPCSPYTGFGSMGPDFLFFSLKEYGTPLDEMTNLLFDVYDAFQPLIHFYEETIEPVEQKINQAIRQVDQALFNGIFGDIEQTAETAIATLRTAAQSVITRNVDLFYPFYPKIQQGSPEDKWYWFDFLHTRRTGEFASHMWRAAQGDPDLQRYVLGYVSHIATDTVGHPFVNAVVGGPWRTHWHRHKLVENWIDAYACNYYSATDYLKPCLNLEPNAVFRENAISGSHYYQLTEFPNGALPGKLANLFAQTMQGTFRTIGDHPVFLSPADLDSAYRLWLQWFQKVTTVGDAQKPTPVPPPGHQVANLVNDYVQGFPSSPGSGSTPSGGFSVVGIFAALAQFIEWVANVVEYTFKWISNHITDILKLPFQLALNTVKWLLYQIQKLIWEVYDNVRFTLVLGGYMFPEPRDLQKNRWGQAFINTASVQRTGGAASQFSDYPLQQELHGLGGPIEHHLVYPLTRLEHQNTESAPKPFHGVNPEAFIDGNFPYDPYIEHLYDCIGPYGPDQRFTNFVNAKTWNTAQFGSALSS